ncbi:hypothetical protein EMEDMD4_790201 [Sinorhizobium medicae]|uniref:Uncharacterized protein n=1 Tax=Sinorhizobium medicae TaxID=110321 RepID=A0A508X5S8_9HYPH|nr:hypothetical protein EMEDMD4_790201 [Sinorhizobium medicae]
MPVPTLQAKPVATKMECKDLPPPIRE